MRFWSLRRSKVFNISAKFRLVTDKGVGSRKSSHKLWQRIAERDVDGIVCGIVCRSEETSCDVDIDASDIDTGIAYLID